MGDRQLIVIMLVALAAAGCSSSDPAPQGAAAVRLTVTRDFGKTVLAAARAAPGQSAMFALRRNTDVGSAYGGRFVSSIDGVKGNQGNGDDWFYFINGIEASTGAAAYRLRPGDREWWDYRYWTLYESVPVVIGAWPDPFVRGYGGAQPTVRVGGLHCAAVLAASLKRRGARLTNGQSTSAVMVETFAAAAGGPLDGAQAPSRGLTVWLQHGAVMVYRGSGSGQPDAAAQAMIAAYHPDGGSQSAAVLVVAGRTQQAACAAAATLADHPAAVQSTYAVALDGSGRVIARGGQP